MSSEMDLGLFAQTGRPTKLTQAVADSVVTSIRSGTPIKWALAAHGITQSTFQDWVNIGSGKAATWRNGDPVSEGMRRLCSAFYEQIARAHGERVQDAIQRIEEAARTPDKFGRPEWRAEAWLLEHHPAYRQDFRSQVQVDNTVRLSPEMRQAVEWAHNASDAELQEHIALAEGRLPADT